MIKEIEYPTYTLGPVASLSWGAIFSGAFVSAVCCAALGLLGQGLGLANITSFAGDVYLVLAAVVSFAVGGWVTGRMTRSGVIGESAIHALTAWAFTVTMFGIGHYWAPYAASPSRQFTGAVAFLLLAVTALAAGLGGSSGTRLMKPHPIAAVREREAIGK